MLSPSRLYESYVRLIDYCSYVPFVLLIDPPYIPAPHIGVTDKDLLPVIYAAPSLRCTCLAGQALSAWPWLMLSCARFVVVQGLSLFLGMVMVGRCGLGSAVDNWNVTKGRDV
jgi:hypothetical protein